MTDSGKTTRWMASVSSRGLTAEGTKDSISMTRRKDMDCSHGQVVANTMESGRMVSSTGKVSITRVRA